MAREQWTFLGAGVARGYGDAIEGRRCYWFRRENIGTGGATRIIPVDTFWPASQAMV